MNKGKSRGPGRACIPDLRVARRQRCTTASTPPRALISGRRHAQDTLSFGRKRPRGTQTLARTPLAVSTTRASRVMRAPMSAVLSRDEPTSGGTSSPHHDVGLAGPGGSSFDKLLSAPGPRARIAQCCIRPKAQREPSRRAPLLEAWPIGERASTLHPTGNAGLLSQATSRVASRGARAGLPRIRSNGAPESSLV